AMASGQALPPLQLYKLGYDYYILDGHHRVAAARTLGIRELEAEVTEFLSSSNAEQQRVFAERREFERITGLNRVGATRPGTYPRLLEMIKEYTETERRARPASPAAATAPKDGTPPAGTGQPSPDEPRPSHAEAEAFKEAARHWYYAFFQPMAQRIRARRLGQAFPGERTADILVRLRDFRAEEARLGHEVSWGAALQHFTAAYSPGPRRRGWDLRRFVPLPRR
ncbi:MAG: ParB N-terminal domain-containing protein, partial [Chloroflexota bacterium]